MTTLPKKDESNQIFETSEFWKSLISAYQAQVQGASVRNMKRTMNNVFYQWLPSSFNDPQIKCLFKFWQQQPSHWPIDIVAENATKELPADVVSMAGDNPFARGVQYHVFYTFFVGLLWYHSACHDGEKLHERLEEPEAGSPIPLTYNGRRISQDLANSIYEWNVVRSLSKLQPMQCPRVLEIGAGYGRLAYVFLSASPSRYVIIDVPDVLAISEWYLSTVFPEKRVFKHQPINNIQSVLGEIENADIVFLTMDQMALLPQSFCDIGVAVSSLHEMRPDQIQYYKQQLSRIVKYAVYLKHWTSWHNPVDNLLVTSNGLKLDTSWQLVLDRVDDVQSDFTELGFIRR